MYKTIKKSRNSGFSKRTNTFEKFRRKSGPWTGNNSLSIIRRYPNISLFNPTLILFILAGSQHQQRYCYFFAPGYLTLCLLVPASVSYILSLRKGYLPGTMGYMINSPTCVRLFLFRFSIAMQKKIAFSQCERPFLLFFFSFPFFPFFFSKNAGFFQGARGAIIGFTAHLRGSVVLDIFYQTALFFVA